MSPHLQRPAAASVAAAAAAAAAATAAATTAAAVVFSFAAAASTGQSSLGHTAYSPSLSTLMLSLQILSFFFITTSRGFD